MKLFLKIYHNIIIDLHLTSNGFKLCSTGRKEIILNEIIVFDYILNSEIIKVKYIIIKEPNKISCKNLGLLQS